MLSESQPRLDVDSARAALVPAASPETSPPDLEARLAAVLAGVLGVERIAVDGHFFDDLGADSMVLAHFCARVRKQEGLPTISMKDVYAHSTIASLACSLSEEEQPLPREPVAAAPVRVEHSSPVSTVQYLLCAALQLLLFFGYSYLTALASVVAYGWVSSGSDVLEIYLRSVVAGAALLVFLFTVPVVAKWCLVGRWKAESIPVWTLSYVRFWLVKTLVQRNLLVFLLAGSPLYSLYLRALGAKVGRGVTNFSLNVPVCTDLLVIGDETVIRKDSFISCYRAHSGVIQTGPVTIGRDVYVGEVTVIDIDVSIGDRAQVGHSSALLAGQAVPADEHWHGSPAQRTDVDYRAVEPQTCSAARRGGYAILQVVTLLALYLPLAIGGISLLLIKAPRLNAFLDPDYVVLSSWSFYGHALLTSLVLFFGSLVVGLLVAVSVPRLLNRAIRPDTVYPLFGLHYTIHRTIARLTNVKVFTFIFGDSSYIVHYLRWIGYDLSHVQQTGSNFGQAVKHENPFLSSVGSGTMVADGLSIMNADFSSSTFSVSRTVIGANSFLGNRIAYPSRGSTGDNCLLATKVMVPVDGVAREGIGLLGAPSFEIPRTVDRDAGFDLESGDELARRLKVKNRHNLVTIGLCLLVRWVFFFAVTLVMSGTAHFYLHGGALAIAVANVVVLMFSIVYFVLVERAVTGLAALKPHGCSIYDPDFWRHERFWKVASVAYLLVFNGTPFKNLIWRSLGVRIGRRVFDDGCTVTERRFTTIGDDATLNAGSIIQCHSQEDGAFKSDRIEIGAGATLGVGALVHYGATVGAGAVVTTDSFVMKGADVPPYAHWGGNPARDLPDTTPALTAARDRDGHAGLVSRS